MSGLTGHFWANALMAVAFFAGACAAFWASLVSGGWGILLAAMGFVLLVLTVWAATGRPRRWGGERVEDGDHWWRGGAASTHR